MKYISIDLEFTSLNLEDAQVLEIGAILEDTELKLPYDQCPKFNCLINHRCITGGVYALAMNSDIIKILAGVEDVNGDDKLKYLNDNSIVEEYEVADKFYNFVCSNGITTDSVNKNKKDKVKLVFAGKNLFSKDIPLIKKLPKWNSMFDISHRVIDPSHYFIDWKNDTIPPSLSLCKERANLGKHVSHRSLDDAWDVIQLLRTQY